MFKEIDVDNIEDSRLAELSRLTNEIEPNVERARRAIELARSFLRVENLLPYSNLVMDPADRREYETFVKKLKV